MNAAKTQVVSRCLSHLPALLLVSVSGLPVDAAGIHTGNILVNPGGETGSIAPWIPNAFTSLASSSASLPGGTVDATEGTYWFMADVIGNRATTGTSGLNGARVEQTIDVSGNPRIGGIAPAGHFNI